MKNKRFLKGFEGLEVQYGPQIEENSIKMAMMALTSQNSGSGRSVNRGDSAFPAPLNIMDPLNSFYVIDVSLLRTIDSHFRPPHGLMFCSHTGQLPTSSGVDVVSGFVYGVDVTTPSGAILSY